MNTVASLPAIWRAKSRAIAKPYGFVTEHVLGKAQALDACADELTALLSEHGGGGEAVADGGIECPTCAGDGGFIEQYCCGIRIDGECCGDPNEYAEQCSTCGGTGRFTNGPVTTPPTPSAPVMDDAFADLRTFYNVETDAELIRIQAQHVERLQEKLPRNDQPIRTKPRFA